MAKLDRKDVQIFAENSKETLITEFRTEDSAGMTASFSRDPDVIQNENYSQGWVNDTNNLNTKIYGEDLNAVNYVLSYLLKYLYENGIAEWKSTTTYYQNSICKVEDALYLSLQNNNIGNDPTSTVSYWKLIPLENVSIEDAGSGFSIVKNVTDNVITFKTISVTGYGEITDNGDQLNIDIAGGGGGGGGDTYWGMIRGTITNQTDLMELINLKQDIFTVDSPLVLTDEQHLTINKATSSVSGYLDYNDFNTFNGKQDTISATLPISITNNNIEIETADTSTTGALSYTDWNTFNGKFDSTNTGIYFTKTTEQSVDTVLIRPNSSTQITSLGTSAKPFTNLYTSQINDSSHPTTEASITEIKTDQLSGITSSTTVNTAADLLPSTTNTYDLGSSSKTFSEGYIGTINTDTIRGDSSNDIDLNRISIKYTPSNGSLGSHDELDIDLASSMGSGYWYIGRTNPVLGLTAAGIVATGIEPSSNNNGWLGNTNNIWGVARIKEIFATTTDSTNVQCETIAPTNGKANLRFNYGGGYSTGGIAPTSGLTSCNLGTASDKWANVYSVNLYGTVQGGCDRNKKENIVERGTEKGETKSVLEKLKSLKTYTYNFKNDEEKRTHIGVMAQDLREIEPLLVTNISEKKDEEDLYVDIMGYCALLTESIQKLNEKVDYLELRVKELEKGNKKELEK